LNKELKTLNTQYFEVTRRFDTILKRFISKHGKNKLAPSEILALEKMNKDRNTIDYSAEVNASLKTPFLRFMRSHFADIKAEELEFYAVMKALKEKALKTSNLRSDSPQGGNNSYESANEDSAERKLRSKNYDYNDGDSAGRRKGPNSPGEDSYQGRNADYDTYTNDVVNKIRKSITPINGGPILKDQESDIRRGDKPRNSHDSNTDNRIQRVQIQRSDYEDED